MEGKIPTAVKWALVAAAILGVMFGAFLFYTFAAPENGSSPWSDSQNLPTE